MALSFLKGLSPQHCEQKAFKTWPLVSLSTSRIWRERRINHWTVKGMCDWRADWSSQSDMPRLDWIQISQLHRFTTCAVWLCPSVITTVFSEIRALILSNARFLSSWSRARHNTNFYSAYFQQIDDYAVPVSLTNLISNPKQVHKVVQQYFQPK